MNKLLYFLIPSIVVLTGLLISKNSIPNQEGYFELAWNFSHLDPKKTIFEPAVTPLNFVVAALLERSLQISLANSWKLMDLMFAGFIALFLTWIYQQTYKPKGFINQLLPLTLVLTSFGFIYSFTSMSGEGMPIFFALVAVFFWQKKRFFNAILFFILSFLSKYTIFLIAPGVFVWTLINFRSFTKRELTKIFLSALIFLAVFVSYNYAKNWGDIKLHFPYIDEPSPIILINNLSYFLVALFLGAPIATTFALGNPLFRNIFWLSSASALIMLSRRYFYWNHIQQIISFSLMYLVTNPKSAVFLQKRYIILQAILMISLLYLLPINSKTFPLFYKHKTIEESLAVQEAVSRDYHGGRIGYYLNRRFDEPFPAYEISYLSPNDINVIRETEYVILPLTSSFPQILKDFNQCSYTFHQQVGLDYLYKVKCET